MNVVVVGLSAGKDRFDTARELATAGRLLGPSPDIEFVSVHLEEASARAVAAQAGLGRVATLSTPLEKDLADVPENIVMCLTAACADADVIVMPDQHDGNELAPRIAFRLGAAFVGNCRSIEVDEKGVRFERSIWGGRAVEAVRPKLGKVVITVPSGRFAKTAERAEANSHRLVDIQAFTWSHPQYAGLEKVGNASSVRLSQANVVVSGGRGLNSAAGFDLLRTLAQELGGAVGASRAAVDAGWISHSSQVGHTGTIVAPGIYFAIGISGAPQHLAGIGGAKFVVAVNVDDEAPIFDYAHVGIVSDYKPIIEELISRLRSKQ